jgi:hypothetical protein
MIDCYNSNLINSTNNAKANNNCSINENETEDLSSSSCSSIQASSATTSQQIFNSNDFIADHNQQEINLKQIQTKINLNNNLNHPTLDTTTSNTINTSNTTNIYGDTNKNSNKFNSSSDTSKNYSIEDYEKRFLNSLKQLNAPKWLVIKPLEQQQYKNQANNSNISYKNDINFFKSSSFQSNINSSTNVPVSLYKTNAYNSHSTHESLYSASATTTSHTTAKSSTETNNYLHPGTTKFKYDRIRNKYKPQYQQNNSHSDLYSSNSSRSLNNSTSRLKSKADDADNEEYTDIYEKPSKNNNLSLIKNSKSLVLLTSQPPIKAESTLSIAAQAQTNNSSQRVAAYPAGHTSRSKYYLNRNDNTMKRSLSNYNYTRSTSNLNPLSSSVSNTSISNNGTSWYRPKPLQLPPSAKHSQDLLPVETEIETVTLTTTTDTEITTQLTKINVTKSVDGLNKTKGEQLINENSTTTIYKNRNGKKINFIFYLIA